jgi:hypothetical protein
MNLNERVRSPASQQRALLQQREILMTSIQGNLKMRFDIDFSPPHLSHGKIEIEMLKARIHFSRLLEIRVAVKWII